MIRLVILPNIGNYYSPHEQVNILRLTSEENYEK